MEKLLLTILTFLLTLLPWAESNGMRVLTRADGLAGESVGCICSDSQGQMWFGTTNGVSMYNGKTITTFRLNDGKHRVFPIKSIGAASDGSIYATTIYGLFVLPMGQSKFKHIIPEIDGLGNIYIINNTLYIGSNQGMLIYTNGKIKTVKVATSTSGIENNVRCIQPKSKGHLYINNRHELFDYDINTGRLTSLGLRKVLPQNISLGSFVIWKNKVFIGTKNNGLFVFTPSTQKLRQVEGFGYIISSINISKDNKLCVATDGAGAFLINPDTEQIIHKFDTQQNDEDRQLTTDAAYVYYRAANGVDWVGTARQGISYNYHNSNLFHTYSFDNFSSKGINVRSFYIHGAEKIIGTLRGFYYINEDTHTIRYFSPKELNGAHIVTNCIYYQNEYYIATYDGGLKILNPQTLQLRQQNIHPILNSTTVYPFNIDKRNRLWIGSSEGLFIVSEDGKIEHYTELNSHISGSLIKSIVFDDKDNTWLPSSVGLSRYIGKEQIFEDTGFPNKFFNKEKNMRATMGHKGNLFFFGDPFVYYTNTSMTDFGELKLPSRLMEESCYDFIDDFSGHYWLSSEKGLFCMDYNLKSATHFGAGEGVNSNVVYSINIKQNKKIWIGTDNGLLSLQKNALHKWATNNTYKVLIYNLRKGSKQQNTGDDRIVNANKTIHLNWNITSAKLYLSPILNDYALQDGRVYEYSLDGNHTWTLVMDGQEIMLSHLLLGRHELTIRLSGAPGTATTYYIYVTPSWLAIAEGILIILFIIAIILLWRYKKNTKVLLNERKEIEEALIEIEQEQQKQEIQKYQRVKIDQQEANDIVARMRNYVEKERIYTNPDLKMSDLADVLHVSSSKLSQIFTQYVGENYYEFINGYRLAEFKRLVSEGEHKHYTLTALSEKCGFKRANFFSTFRKVEGMTPAEYMKKNNS